VAEFHTQSLAGASAPVAVIASNSPHSMFLMASENNFGLVSGVCDSATGYLRRLVSMLMWAEVKRPWNA